MISTFSDNDLKATTMRIPIRILLFLFCVIHITTAYTQDFRVDSFRQLSNDVSAFINPVKDLNDEDCALIKVIASEDFAFSTPLGIVKRLDNVGEIWLYIPRKSKKLTIKHPKYGVLRDYIFPEKIESHLTYEMHIDEPRPEITFTGHEGAVTTTLRDTLILTKTDTITLVEQKPKIPFSLTVQATYTFGGNTHTSLGGIMLTAMKSHGGYLHISTDFGSNLKYASTSDQFGNINGESPFYSGSTHNCAFHITGGAIHRISKIFNVYEGVGYGFNRRYWEKAKSEGGGYIKNSHYSYEGFMIELGTTASFGKFAVTASVKTIECSQWFGTIGVGFKF